MNDISVEELKNVLSYNPETGIFIWIKSVSRKIKVGAEAGATYIAKNTGAKRRVIRINGVLYFAHRLAWLYITGQFPKNHIDHIDQNPLNNAFKNLRDVTNLENRKNSHMQKNNSSGHVGVYFDVRCGKYEAYISVLGKRKFLGYFKEYDDAVYARESAEKEYGYSDAHGRNKI